MTEFYKMMSDVPDVNAIGSGRVSAIQNRLRITIDYLNRESFSSQRKDNLKRNSAARDGYAGKVRLLKKEVSAFITHLDRNQTGFLAKTSEVEGSSNKVISIFRIGSYVRQIERTSGEVLRILDVDFASDELGASTTHLGDRHRDKIIPEPVPAPLQILVVDDVLQSNPGSLRYVDRERNSLVKYLRGQSIAIETTLSKTNVDPQIIGLFAELTLILSSWTDANVLSFGAHLELLTIIRGSLEEELTPLVFSQFSAFLTTSRRLVNGSDVWSEFIRDGREISEKSTDTTGEILKGVSDAAEILSEDQESVDQKIPASLRLYAKLQINAEMAVTGLASSVSSITNIMISCVTYSLEFWKNNKKKVGDSSSRLISLLCRLRPVLVRLASLHPNLAWFASFDEDLKVICSTLHDSHSKNLL